jgi:hypothetical protein
MSKKTRAEREAIHSELQKRMAARKASRRAVIEGLRSVQDELGRLEKAKAELLSHAIPDEEWDYEPVQDQRPLWPNGLPICMEIRDYYGRVCHTYRPGGGRRYGRKRR